MEKLLLVLGLCALCCPPASPLSTGAPLGSCETMAPRHRGFSPQTIASPHSILVQNVKNSSNVQVYIQGPTYKGILLEARYPNGTTAVGTWATPPANTKTIKCFSKIDSAITHSNTNDKSNETIYTWIPPSFKNCDQKAVVFRATVAQAKATYWLNLNSEKIYVACSGSLISLSGFAVLITFMVAGLAEF
ncbi:putative defense protein 3 [Mustelus asterias]